MRLSRLAAVLVLPLVAAGAAMAFTMPGYAPYDGLISIDPGGMPIVPKTLHVNAGVGYWSAELMKPMLAKAVDGIPERDDLLFEPKWDGFRCIVFRDGDDIELTSRNQKPFNRYFPDLIEPLLAALPDRCVVDGEIVVADADGNGNPYDDFGKYITDLSEEMWKLRKFKNYTNRSTVMAEGLRDYVQVIQERIITINKKIKDEMKANPAPGPI